MNNSTNGHKSHWWKWGTRPRAPQEDLAPYRRIALQLHHDLRERESRSVLLASPTASPLDARNASTLSFCLAEELGQRILLVDASARTRALSHLLGCAESPGVSDLLVNAESRLDSLALPTSRENVWFLPAGSRLPAASATAPEALQTMLKSALGQFEFVVLSAGAVLGDSTALAIAPYAGCVLLFVVENETTVDDLDASHNALNICKARKVALVLTARPRGNGTQASAHAG